jgi:transposase
MIFAFISSPEQEEELKQAILKAKEIKWYKRLKIIQLSLKGKSVPQLSLEFDLCPLTIRHYIHQYTKGGLESLAPSYGKGGFQKLYLSQEAWEELLHQSPSQFDKLSTACRNLFVGLTELSEWLSNQQDIGPNSYWCLIAKNTFPSQSPRQLSVSVWLNSGLTGIVVSLR